jgi:hypothetical protein
MCDKHYVVHEEEYKGHTIKILTDDMAESPREWDNLGTMVCFHRNYKLGDKHDFQTPDEVLDFIKSPDVISLPLFLYDHSGITMNTTGFSCPWDSGQVGIIYITKETIRKEMSRKRGNKYVPIKHVTKKDIERALDLLRSEVKTYDYYITGNVTGFVIEKDDEDIDSCWGFIGDYDNEDYGSLSEARSIVDHVTDEVTAI